DVEEPGLVMSDGGRSRAPAPGPPPQAVDQLGAAQQQATQPGVRPDAILDPCNDDEWPRLSRCAGRSEDRDGITDRGPWCQGVPGNFLLIDVGEERRRVGLGKPVREPGRGLEECEHGVEIPVCAGTGGPTGQRGVPPAGGQPECVPHRPEDVLDEHAWTARSPSELIDVAAGEEPGGMGSRDATGTGRLDADLLEDERTADRLDGMLVTGPAPAGPQLDLSQPTTQSPQGHRVGAADAGAEQLDDELGGQPTGLVTAPARED